MLPRESDSTLSVKMPCMHHTIPGRHDYPSGDFYSWLFDRDRGGNRTTKFCLATYLIPLHMVWQCGGHQNRPTNAQETTRFGTWLPTSARPPRPTHPPPFTKVTNLGGQAPTHTLLTLVKNISVKLSLIVYFLCHEMCFRGCMPNAMPLHKQASRALENTQNL